MGDYIPDSEDNSSLVRRGGGGYNSGVEVVDMEQGGPSRPLRSKISQPYVPEQWKWKSAALTSLLCCVGAAVILLIVLVGLSIAILVVLSGMKQQFDDQILDIKRTNACELRSLCTSLGLEAECKINQGIHKCGLGLRRGPTSSFIDYITQFSSYTSDSDSSSHHSSSTDTVSELL